MDEKIDAIMDRLYTYLQDQSLELVVSVEEENYEKSQTIKDEMDEAIGKVADILISRGAVTIPKTEAIARLNELTYKTMDEWYDVFEVPEERRVK